MVIPGVYKFPGGQLYEVDLDGAVWFTRDGMPKHFSVYNGEKAEQEKDFRVEFLLKSFETAQGGDGLW